MAGRPTKYNVSVNRLVEKFCMLGVTDEQMADLLEIDVATFDRWKAKYKSLRGAINKGKAFADADVAKSLYQRATGYSCPEVDIRVVKGKIVKTNIVRRYPPDPTSMIFWLKNRQKLMWRDKIEHGMTDGNGKDVNPVYVFKLPDNGRESSSG